MLCLGTHKVSGKVGSTAASFTVAAMGTEWSQRGEQITLPVDSKRPYTLNITGAKFPDGGTTF